MQLPVQYPTNILIYPKGQGLIVILVMCWKKEETGIKINEQVFEYLNFYPGKILFFYVRHKKTFSP